MDNMITEVAIHEIKLEQIQKTLDEILEHVKETNGSICEHAKELAANNEWRNSACDWKDEVDSRFDKLENRLWILATTGSFVGTIAGIVLSIFINGV